MYGPGPDRIGSMDVEFRAGKLKLDLSSGRSILRPDERKGMVRAFMSADDGIVHFTWFLRPNGVAEVFAMSSGHDFTASDKNIAG